MYFKNMKGCPVGRDKTPRCPGVVAGEACDFMGEMEALLLSRAWAN